MFITVPLPFFLPDSADEKASFIRDRFVFINERIPVSDYQIITDSTVSAGAAADQLAMNLLNAEEITVAKQRQYMEKIMFPGKLRIRTLRKVITGTLLFIVKSVIDIAEAFRILLINLLIFSGCQPEDKIDQPDVKVPVEIEYLSQSDKRPMKR